MGWWYSKIASVAFANLEDLIETEKKMFTFFPISIMGVHRGIQNGHLLHWKLGLRTKNFW